MAMVRARGFGRNLGGLAGGLQPRKLIGAALVAAALASAGLSARADSLADTLVAAYRNSNLLDQSRALLRATDEDVVQAQAAILPVVNFVTQATTSSAAAYDYRLNFGVTLSMTLLDFGRGQLGIDATREQVLSARAGLVVVEQQVLMNAVTSFLNLYSTRETVRLRQSNMELVEQQLRAARQRFELGDSTRSEVLLAEARRDAARASLAAAEGEVAVAREDYNFAVGRYPSGISAPPPLPRLPASLEAALEVARRHHPAISQAQHQVSAAEIAARINATARYGAVTGSLSAGHAVTGVPGLGSVGENDVSATLGYQVPLYTGGAQASSERQFVARHQAQRAALHQTVASVNQAVSSSWTRLSVARQQLSTSALSIEAAQAAYDAVVAEAEFGTRTTLDVLDAEQGLLDARSNRIYMQAQVQQATYALLSAMGQLTVQALNLGVPVYDVEAYAANFRRGREARPSSPQGARLDRIQNRYQRVETER